MEVFNGISSRISQVANKANGFEVKRSGICLYEFKMLERLIRQYDTIFKGWNFRYEV